MGTQSPPSIRENFLGIALTSDTAYSPIQKLGCIERGSYPKKIYLFPKNVFVLKNGFLFQQN